ncbi:MAG: phosphate acyltransferase [Hyphomicrobiales bacterium]
MNIVTELMEAARGAGGRVVLPEGDDVRVVAAARQLVAEDLAIPVLLGAEGNPGAGIELCEPAEDPRFEAYVDVLSANSKHTSGEAAALLQDPLYFAGMMVREGDADALLAGAANPTADVLRAGLKTVGLAEGIRRMSSFFLMAVPDVAGEGPRNFIFADCAVNIDPGPEDLADIAIASAATAARWLNETPRVAMLSFSTRGSADHDHIDKVTAALEVATARAPDLAIDGELQLDSAIIPTVAARKVTGNSKVAGRANVLIFPDLDSANIGYKLTQYMGNAQAIGPFLQGFARPVCDLSRGASVADIVSASAITLAMG